MNDYFEVLELPRKLQVDLDALQRKFYALSRRYHPDFHPTAVAADQALVLERSALLNRAYRVLREPLSRLAHLISLEHGSEEEPIKPKAPMDLLEEMLEVQETLEEAKASGQDNRANQRLLEERQSLTERQAAGDAVIVERFAEWDRAVQAGHDTRPLLAWFEQALARRAYLRTVIDDLNDALGEEQDSHVSHRRH